MTVNYGVPYMSSNAAADDMEATSKPSLDSLDAALKVVDNKISNAPTWIAPTLTNGWVNLLAGTTPAGYYIRGGVVHLRGTIAGGTAAVAAFTLPAGYRPALTHLFSVLADPGVARLDVGADGTVTVRSYAAGGSNAIVSLNGVSFSTV